MSIKRGLAAAAAACALLTVAACGSDGGDDPKDPSNPLTQSSAPAEPKAEPNGVEKLTAQEIFDKSEAAFKGATALRINGTMAGGGMRMDMAVDDTGDCDGKVAQDGAQVQLMKQSETVYLKMSGAFWRQFAGEDADAAQALVGDRWIKATTSDQGAEDFSQMCDLKELTGSMSEDGSSARDSATKGATTTVDGVPVVEVKYESDEDGPMTMYVSTVGKPYPVKLTGTDDGKAAEVTFSDYDQPVEIKAPAASEVLDYAQLQQAAQAGASAGAGADSGNA
ncbi:hypothetical protein GCM10027168_24610 [Streptomyces capparidis]